MDYVALFIQILKLGMLITGEIFAEKKRAREALEAFKLDEKLFKMATESALKKMLKEGEEDTSQVGDVDDQMDQRLKELREKEK